MRSSARCGLFFAALLLLVASLARGDEIVFANGEKLEGCYVRDEGLRIRIWRDPQRFPDGAEVFERNEVRSFRIQRGPEFDAVEPAPDLAVTHIEVLPRLAGFHGCYEYDETGAPRLELPAAAGTPKTSWNEGEELTFVAHVVNTGRATANAFSWTFSVDGEEIARGNCDRQLLELERTSFETRWSYRAGDHEIRFALVPDGAEIASFNDERKESLGAFAFCFVVDDEWVAHLHSRRNTLGTFSFEDYYLWHLDLMNELLAASRHPATPEGCPARVRLDRIVYAEEPGELPVEADGLGHHQGGWVFRVDPAWRKDGWPASDRGFLGHDTEWSMPHELGHQLGLIDEYNLDYHGADSVPGIGDRRVRTAHFFEEPARMMHWHGPSVFSEWSADYLARTNGKPRGAFGEYVFSTPDETWLRVVDVNGEAVAGAKVWIYQRGAVRLQHVKPMEQEGVVWHHVLENGEFPQALSAEAIVVGETDELGFMRLPNRPVTEVETPNGYRRRANPFGNVNVVGQRGLMLARVEKGERVATFWISIHDLNRHVFRGGGPRCELLFKTDFASAHGPAAPVDARLERDEEGRFIVRWNASSARIPHDGAAGYRVFRRISSEGLNCAPWDVLCTLPASAREHVAGKLEDFPDSPAQHTDYKRYAFGVAAIDALGRSSEIVELTAPRLDRVRDLHYDESSRRFYLAIEDSMSLVEVEGYGRYRDAMPDVRAVKDPRGPCVLPWGEAARFDARSGEIVCFDPNARDEAVDRPPLDTTGPFAHPLQYAEPILQPKVLVLNFDPLVPANSNGEERLSKVAGWNDPHELAKEFRSDLFNASGGYVLHCIAEWRDLDIYPPKVDGFHYDDASYLAAKAAGKWHDPDGIDYARLVADQGLSALVASGAIDEVWMFGGPAFGFYETQMVGPGAYWCNSTGLDDQASKRLFVIFGFNYERGVAEMIHDLGHMTESIMSRVYESQVGPWRAEDRRSAWELFSAYDARHPGRGGVGNCHYPVNALSDYDYANERVVPSTAIDWLFWPQVPPAELRQSVSRETWGGPDYHRNYQRWFFAHLPRRPGRAPDGRLANWWEYLFHMNAHAESRGTTTRER